MAEKKIGSETYKVDPLLASEALILQARLLRAAGPLAAKLPAILASRRPDASVEEKEAAEAAALAAITDVFSGMSPVDFATLVKDVVEIAMIKRPSGQYDQVDLDGDLSSRKGDILPLAILVLREQFGDFFSAALANGARAMAAKGSQSVK